MIQNNDLQLAVEQLTEPWEQVFSPSETGRDGYTVVPQDPLLDMLYDARWVPASFSSEFTMGQLVYSKGMKVANNPETEGTQ